MVQRGGCTMFVPEWEAQAMAERDAERAAGGGRRRRRRRATAGTTAAAATGPTSGSRGRAARRRCPRPRVLARGARRARAHAPPPRGALARDAAPHAARRRARYKEIPPRFQRRSRSTTARRRPIAAGSYGYPSSSYEICALARAILLLLLRDNNNTNPLSTSAPHHPPARPPPPPTTSLALPKVVSRDDGLCYCLRQRRGSRARRPRCARPRSSAGARSRATRARARTSSRARARSCTTASVFFVHDFVPCARTLLQAHGPRRAAAAAERAAAAAAVSNCSASSCSGRTRTAERGAAARPLWRRRNNRAMGLRHVLVTPGGGEMPRARLGGAGVVDVLEAESRPRARRGAGRRPGRARPRAARARAQVHGTATCTATAARAATMAEQSSPPSASAARGGRARLLVRLSRNGSCTRARRLTVGFAASPTARGRPRRAIGSIFELCDALAGHALDCLDNALAVGDALEAQLCREAENARALRLLLKLGAVNERPEFAMNPAWSDTGERYLLKLFRNFVFHQVARASAGGARARARARRARCASASTRALPLAQVDADGRPRRRLWPRARRSTSSTSASLPRTVLTSADPQTCSSRATTT